MRILFVTPDLSSNSLGRTYALSLLAEAAGAQWRVISEFGNDIWSPLNNSDFSNRCQKIDSIENFELSANETDVIIAIKPLAHSLVAAHKLGSNYNIPVISDIDDPDLLATLRSSGRLKRNMKWFLKTKTMMNATKRKKLAFSLPTIVSNPVLQKFHGGIVIPHVRPQLPSGSEHQGDDLRVVFVGTNRHHKGVDLLREVIRVLQKEMKISLTITDDAPDKVYPWEVWTGATTVEEGNRLVADGNVVVIPSLPSPFAHGQLPAKLIDAMLIGCPVVVSGIEPMPWAIGSAGIVVRPGSEIELISALRRLRDANVRNELGRLAKLRATEMFTVEKNLSKFVEIVNISLRGHR